MPPSSTITLATRVTLLRILGVPVFVGFVVYYLASLKTGAPVEAYRHIAAGIFILVAATDALDGYLARKYKEVSRLGTILDPLADKGLLLSGLILLTRPSLPELWPHIPLWFTLLVISRDAVLIAGALLIHYVASEVKVRPHLTGKGATALQMLTILLVLLHANETFFLVVLSLAALLTAISGWIYLRDGALQLEQAAHAKHAAS